LGKNLIEAELMRNPSDKMEWFIMQCRQTGKRFMRVNDDDSIIVSSDMELFFSIVKMLDFRQMMVHN
jgi:hypothetical protein